MQRIKIKEFVEKFEFYKKEGVEDLIDTLTLLMFAAEALEEIVSEIQDLRWKVEDLEKDLEKLK